MRIHFISIGGAVMHNLALELQALGHDVSGSDDEIFDPARSRLAAAGLLPTETGWFPDKITTDIALIVLGMHARSDNQELIMAKELGLRIESFPQFIYSHSKHKMRLVVAGSHGKTSTTAMLMHALQKNGKSFDYLVGSSLQGFERMVRLSDAPLMVIEGDEYLTSPLDPIPKFMHYQPHHAVITGIAWDHINVFPTLDKYIQAFRNFAETVNGHIYYCHHDGHLQLLANVSPLKFKPYGALKEGVTPGTIDYLGKTYPIRVFGKHNLENMHAAMLLGMEAGISAEKFLLAMSDFKGTARRLEQVYADEKLVIIRDFAHSPSKCTASVEAVRKRYADHVFIAAYELHTFSSLRRDFLEDYRDAMHLADIRFVMLDPHVFELKKLPPLADQEVEAVFDARVVHEPETLRAAIMEGLQTAMRPVVVLLMSSGNFGGLQPESIRHEL